MTGVYEIRYTRGITIYTMGNPEQFSLNLDPVPSNPYEHMGNEELSMLYREKVGVSPRIGRNSKEHLIWAIQNPQEERDELQRIDLVEDQENRRNNKM